MSRRSRLLLALFAVLGGVLLVLALQEGPEPGSELAQGSGAPPEVSATERGSANTTTDTPLAAPQLPGAAATGRIAGGGSPGAGVLRGRLFDEHGEPVANATVTVTQDAAEEAPNPGNYEFQMTFEGASSEARVGGVVTPPEPTRTTTHTDAEGRFEVPNLAARPLTVRATERLSQRGASGALGVVTAHRSASAALDHPDQEIELRLAPGVRLFGQVVGPAGRPVSSFHVTAWLISGDSATEDPFEGLADFDPDSIGWGNSSGGAWDRAVKGKFEGVDGRFTLAGLHEGSWRVTVSQSSGLRFGSDGRGDPFQAVRVVDLPHSGVVRIVLPVRGLLEGEVRTSFGDPAPFALVELTGLDDGTPDKRVTTGEDGRFEVQGLVRGRRYRVVAKHREHAASEPAEFEMNPTGASQRIEVRLRSFARLTGRVHAAHAQRAGRFLTLRGPESASTTSDTDGRFAFERVTPGAYRLELAAASDEKGGDAATETLELTEGQHAQVVLGGPPAHGIRVFGVVQSGGAVREGLDVTLAGGGSTVRTTTDASGRYEVEVEGPGEYRLRLAEGAQHHRATLQVPEGDELRYDVELATGSISGTVTNREGAPLASVALTLTGDSLDESAATTTAADGTYTFGFLPSGDYAVRLLQPSEGEVGAAAVDATLASGEERRGLDFRLERPARIEGRVWLRTSNETRIVTKQSGAGATIRLRFADGRSIATTRSDADGAFLFEAVPHGPLLVEVSLGDAVSEVPLTCAPGETTPINLRLDLGDG